MALAALCAYLIGSLNTSIIVSKLIMKKDIREIGSGNAGFTNSMRTGSRLVAILTLVGDVVKVGISVLIGGFLMQNCLPGESEAWLLGAYIAGFFSMVGHIFPLYFGFRGGKGVLTFAAMILFTDWKLFLIVIALWLILLFFTRMVSLSVLITLPVYILGAILFAPDGTLTLFGQTVPMRVFTIGTSVLMGIIVVVMHKDNIKRLRNGTENKIGQKAK